MPVVTSIINHHRSPITIIDRVVVIFALTDSPSHLSLQQTTPVLVALCKQRNTKRQLIE